MKMTRDMGPPPSKIPIKSDHLSQPSPSVPPPSSNSGPDAEPHSDPEQPPTSDSQPLHPTPALSGNAPYNIPPWSQPPTLPFFIEVLKGGAIVDQLDISKKGAYMFGRVDLCDFTLDHPTISRFHAVIQFKSSNAVYLYDLGSTHGTFVNKQEVKKMVYVELHVGDVLRFGRSTRLYILQGPTELMPPEAQFRDISNRQIQEEISDREASLQRAKRQAALADGISWGIGEDAVEEAEDDSDEVTWQTYKGQLTEKQEKTREKVIKRLEKIAHMKKEIDAIRVKDIPQGGLTQGQQTQIARNELRISQIMEELENLEETLNESIRESLGARIGRKLSGRKRGEEVEEELSSDDDDFYDRTKKPAQKAVESQSVETADSLLDKREAIMKEIEEYKKMISDGRSNLESEMKGETEAGDSLDAYMSGLSSRLVIDKTEHLEKKLATLESELNRVVYLLKIADPSGEASKKRELKLQEPKIIELETCFPNVVNQPPKGQKKHDESHKVKDQGTNTSVTLETNQNQKAECVNSVSTEIITTPYTAVKPQWLGAIDDTAPKEEKKEVVVLNDSKEFVDYKDRDKVLGKTEHTKEVMSIENSAPGLILRKRKEVEVAEVSPSGCMEQSTSLSTGIQIKAEDAVALLLKHSKGYHEIEMSSNEDIPSTDSKRPKRVLGPEKPSFLEDETVYETWVPPEGQSGDGRTSLNDRFGY
uniref:FHA domain-containing protein n=1 Tax=Kalanchoe fedtschenkoi TaxID=63787 RepID=A0A7N0UWR3_KALFE